ncbi:MAG TPA: MaoC/PaaZ C-terminal domain-containing protein [Acetobacteraceae bacterium]|nr:MaoC/PaaZ C-terminal domain-containing protein [Acetobacteraceae bacterium]
MPPVHRRFDLNGQTAFADLSGDHNPMHLDLQAARRLLLGGVAVHGIHLLLWALDSVVATGTTWQALDSVRAHFDRPALLGEDIALQWQTSDEQVTVTAHNAVGRVMRLKFNARSVPDRPVWDGLRIQPPLVCQEQRMAGLATMSGHLDLVLPESFATLFPHLHAAFSPLQAAILLASTRLVGMICPGRHSLFSGLALQFAPTAATAGALEYAVSRADERVRMVDITLSGSGCCGTLETFLRPEPVAQLSFAALRDAVPRGSFTGQRALVIGGARGLGELTAKLLAIGGADVSITYLNGADDAAAIVTDGSAAGCSLQTLHFDVAAPPGDVAGPDGGFTHAYYFATPRIVTGPPVGFAAELLARYLEYYVTGLARSVAWLQSRSVADLRVWYPSSVFVEQAPPGFAEYATAKACGEALCAQMTTRMSPMQVIADRLPRLATDQTQSLTTQTLEDSVAILRSILLRLA